MIEELRWRRRPDTKDKSKWRRRPKMNEKKYKWEEPQDEGEEN